MNPIWSSIAILFALTLSAAPQTAPSTQTAPARTPATSDPAIAPAEEAARAALAISPRHAEYVSIPLGGDGRTLTARVIYPERPDKAPVVIVIHEIFGLTDWIRAVADRLAAEGFIAVAPDLLSGMGPGGGNSEAFASRDDVIKAIRDLTPEQTLQRLTATREFALKIPAANGHSAAIGFCWGGSASFAFAASGTPLDAAVVYYGTAPDATALARVSAPVLGLYGGDDARVNATIEAARAEMTRLGKRYEVEIFEGAGHGFLRNQSDRNGANRKAALAAWPRMLTFLRDHTR